MAKILQRIYPFPPFMFLVHQNQYVAKQVTEFKPNLRLRKKYQPVRRILKVRNILVHWMNLLTTNNVFVKRLIHAIKSF